MDRQSSNITPVSLDENLKSQMSLSSLSIEIMSDSKSVIHTAISISSER